MSDLGRWLDELGLGQYATAFAENDIEFELLPELTDTDLEKLGMSSLGHRKKLLAAISKLGENKEPSNEAPSVQSWDKAPGSYTPGHLAERILASREALMGERKQVTVLFADVKGSLEMIEGTDAERAQALLDGAVGVMMDAVHRYEGTVNKVLGDGVMALFGAPLAHEDHAVRACYAALAIQKNMAEFADEARRLHGVEVRARAGLHSGEVVVRAIGNDLSMDYDAIGPTVHLASRMEQLAAPGTARLTAETLRLAEGFVAVEPLGPVPVKGLKAPVEVFELSGIGAARTRLQAAAARGLTRFVGREAEIDALAGALDRVAEGRGEVAAVVGEPGVGKSRLFYEFTRSHRVKDWLVLESSSVSYGKASQWIPVIDLLRRYFGIDETDDRRRIGEKVAGKVLMLDEALRPTLAPLLSLLDAPVDDPAWTGQGAPQRRRLIIDAVKGLLVRESEVQPLVLVFEDLHWVDGETQAFLDSLVESLPAARILLLANYRPEYAHEWGGRTYYAQLRIDPLGAESAEGFLATLLGDDAGLAELTRLLIERTEGNPLYLEESVRTLVETGVLAGARGTYRLESDVGTIDIPASVQAIIAARIDRLTPETKGLLQTAAIVGKHVPHAVLEAVAETPEDALHRGLAALQAAEFLYEAQLFPSLEYSFKHALTHEVAYGTVLKDRRKALHRGAGAAIEALYPERLGEFAETLANHFERGEVWDKAATYLLSLAERAKERFAYASAAGFCARGREAAAHGDGLVAEAVRAHTLSGDVASLMGEMEAANGFYDTALDLESDPARRPAVANRRHRQHFIERDGAKIAFYEHGGGETTLFFHNPMVYGLITFQPVLERLCQEFRIITMDPRGTGASDPLPRRYRLGQHGEDVRAVIEEAGGPVVGVGISRGGPLFVNLAVKAPSLLEKLVLVGSQIDSHNPGTQFPVPEALISKIASAFQNKDSEQLMRDFTPYIISEPGTADLAEQFLRGVLDLPPETIMGFFTLDPEIDIVPLLDQVRAPILVMHGTEDRLFPFAAAQFLAEHIPGAQLYAFAGRGHLVTFTAAQEFCDVLRQFVITGEAADPKTSVAKAN